MRSYTIIILSLVIAAFASCGKNKVDDNATTTINGRIWPKGTTTYTYGTHLITVDRYTSYLVESTSLNLDSFDGDSVMVTMKDMGIRVNPGPELYNVITVKPL